MQEVSEKSGVSMATANITDLINKTLPITTTFI